MLITIIQVISFPQQWHTDTCGTGTDNDINIDIKEIRIEISCKSMQAIQ